MIKQHRPLTPLNKMRPYLVFCSTNAGIDLKPELFGEGRQFDVFLHDYSAGALTPEAKDLLVQAEHYLQVPGEEKLHTAAQPMRLYPKYQAYAFLDDDLEISTEDLNRCFQIGDLMRLDLWQPALSPDSEGSHRHLFKQASAGIRPVPFVEIMCPFFSNYGLRTAISTFDSNQSGWGVDCYMWPERLSGYVLDTVTVRHMRPPGTIQRKMLNGLTPMQELWILTKIYHPENVSAPPKV